MKETRKQFTLFISTICDGELRPLTRRYFPRARDLLEALNFLESQHPANPLLVSLAAREVGAFHRLTRVEIEAIAAEEGGRDV